MKKLFFAKPALFLALLFLCDRGIYGLLSAGFFKTETGETGGFINKILSVRADALIIGSSRAKHHYDPEIFEKALHVSVYNAGANGQGMPYIRALTDLVLKTYAPQMLILNIDASNIICSREENDGIKNLAPFIDRSDALKRILYAQNLFEPVKYLSKSYRYNSKPFAIVKNLYAAEMDMNGFSGLTRTMDAALFMASMNQTPAKALSADAGSVLLLRETIRAAKREGVKIFMVNGPRWRPDNSVAGEQKPLLLLLQRIADEERVPYLSVTIENHPQFQNPALYSDPAHLNVHGAILFSEAVAQWVAQLRRAEFNF